MSVEEVSLYFLGGDPISYFGLVPIDPQSSCQAQVQSPKVQILVKGLGVTLKSQD